MSLPQIDQTFFYLFEYGFPAKGFNPQNANGTLTSIQMLYYAIQNWTHNLEVIIPSIIVFISFVVALGRLQTLPKATSSEKKIHKASVTITLATALFLALNLPFFLMLSFMMYDKISNADLKNQILFNSPYYHMWPISKVLFVTLNATLNPLLYFFRIGRFQRWIKSLFLHDERGTINFEETLIKNRTEAERADSPLVSNKVEVEAIDVIPLRHKVPLSVSALNLRYTAMKTNQHCLNGIRVGHRRRSSFPVFPCKPRLAASPKLHIPYGNHHYRLQK
jgi:hypothetical protein